MATNLCQYCGELEIAGAWFGSCANCVFNCGKCHKLTPYEQGYAGSDLCDTCFSWADLRAQITLAIKELEILTDSSLASQTEKRTS
jgi:hypothetical protein